MKISPELLNILIAQGDAVSVRGRWFLAVDCLEGVYDLSPSMLGKSVAQKLPEPLPFDEAEAEASQKQKEERPKRGH